MGLLLWPAALFISPPGAESRATRFYRIYNQRLNQPETFWCTRVNTKQPERSMTNLPHNKMEKIKAIQSTLRMKHFSVPTAREITRKREDRLPSGIPMLDTFLEGGLPMGAVTELGLPLGKEGRRFLLWFLSSHHRGVCPNPLWALWVSSHTQYRIYPPAWFAHGVDPERMVFSESQNPIRELKEVIMNPFFRFLVFDSPPKMRKEGFAFLAAQGAENRRVTVIIRNYFLSNQNGNVMAKLRVNCWRDPVKDRFIIRVIRGLSTRELILEEES